MKIQNKKNCKLNFKNNLIKLVIIDNNEENSFYWKNRLFSNSTLTENPTKFMNNQDFSNKSKYLFKDFSTKKNTEKYSKINWIKIDKEIDDLIIEEKNDLDFKNLNNIKIANLSLSKNYNSKMMNELNLADIYTNKFRNDKNIINKFKINFEYENITNINSNKENDENKIKKDNNNNIDVNI